MSKNLEEMSNAEIKIYQKQLTDEYECIKKEIQDRLDKLSDMDNEYNRTERELNKRKTKFTL